MTNSLSKSIFYIKYFATKYGETIERKGTLDGIAKGEYILVLITWISGLLKNSVSHNIERQVLNGK